MDFTALALTLAGFGVVLIALSYQLHRRHRDLSALLHGISGALLFLVGTLLLPLALNFSTYGKLSANQPLAELTIEQVGPKRFNVYLMRIPAGDLQVFALSGDHWQLEARRLIWRDWAQGLGMESQVRLEQLSSSIESPLNSQDNSRIANERIALVEPGSRYSVSRNPGISIWDLKHQYPNRLLALQTQQLQTPAYALQNGLRFHVYLTDGSLSARPINRPRNATPSAGKVVNAPVVNYKGTPGPGKSWAAAVGTNVDIDPDASAPTDGEPSFEPETAPNAPEAEAR